jgi:hypothetical protein
MEASKCCNILLASCSVQVAAHRQHLLDIASNNSGT